MVFFNIQPLTTKKKKQPTINQLLQASNPGVQVFKTRTPTKPGPANSKSTTAASTLPLAKQRWSLTHRINVW